LRACKPRGMMQAVLGYVANSRGKVQLFPQVFRSPPTKSAKPSRNSCAHHSSPGHPNVSQGPGWSFQGAARLVNSRKSATQTNLKGCGRKRIGGNIQRTVPVVRIIRIIIRLFMESRRPMLRSRRTRRITNRENATRHERRRNRNRRERCGTML
jgi:hypothetical protein